jgi:hypothetical protein
MWADTALRQEVTNANEMKVSLLLKGELALRNLLRKGADVNAMDIHGQTPLSSCSKWAWCDNAVAP